MKKFIYIVLLFIGTNTAYAQHSGKQAIFNASDSSYIDYGKAINLTGFSSLSGGKKLSITLWVKWDTKTDASVGQWANLFTMADSSSSGDNGVFWIQHNSDNTKFEFALQNSSSRQLVQSTMNPVEGQWYHIACVFDGTLSTKNMKLYINGIENASLTTTSSRITTFSPKSKLNVGRWANPSNDYRRFNGMIDEISVWSKALTPAQINSIMNAPESVTNTNYSAPNLIGYFNFDDGTSDDLTHFDNTGITGGGVLLANSGTLPIELVQFDVVRLDGKPAIEWTTATELNNNYFTVERSIDGMQGEIIGVVQGAGNSNMMLDYQFVDPNPVSGTAYYRIKQTDFDGTTETFSWKAINLSENQSSKFNVYPNPTTGSINLSLSAITATQTTVTVFDLSGRELFNQIFDSNGTFFATIDLSSNLSAGIYYIQVQNDNQRSIEKIILK